MTKSRTSSSYAQFCYPDEVIKRTKLKYKQNLIKVLNFKL
jgi:hypothetical protein